jgi:quinol monooxygenase YgiN
VRDAKYLGLATRICAEMGAHFVKTYFCEKGFARVAAGCPVPLVIAGGKKLPELEALQMAWQAVNEGAAGVDMGRNIFQCDAPQAMIQAVRAVVHGDEAPEKAFDLYLGLKSVPANRWVMTKKNTVQVVCVAEFYALEGKTDDLVASLHSLIKATTAEPGCIRYELNQRVDDPRWVTFVFDEHCQMSYITHYFNEVRPQLVEKFEVKLYQEILP